jgi:predicted acyltransferase
MQPESKSTIRKPSATKRIASIDQFRGFAILLMVLADYFNNISTVPAWLKHAPDIGYTLIDLVAPLFVFAIGLTYGMSFRRRFDRYGAWRTYNHFFFQEPGTNWVGLFDHLRRCSDGKLSSYR